MDLNPDKFEIGNYSFLMFDLLVCLIRQVRNFKLTSSV